MFPRDTRTMKQPGCNYERRLKFGNQDRFGFAAAISCAKIFRLP
jgi:hypothetical protein